VSFVMRRIAAGDSARFFHSHFGQQVVELSRSWTWIKRNTRVSLPSLEIARVKDALHARRNRMMCKQADIRIRQTTIPGKKDAQPNSGARSGSRRSA